jgi:uncharacterized protein YjbI with pentapeptide repeats
MSKEALKQEGATAPSDPATAGKKKVNKSLEAAKAKSNDLKLDSGVINKPKFVKKGRDFVGMRMKDVFESGILKNVDFKDADLTDADFTWIEEVKNAKHKTVQKVLRGFIVQGCDFRGAKLDGANFAACDLRWSDFTGTDYSNALFGIEDEEGNFTNQANVKEVDGMTR